MSPEHPDAESRFRERIVEDEDRFLADPPSWPRAPSAGWRQHGKGIHLCLFCDGLFQRKKKKVPCFCSAECRRAATSVRRQYREEMIRRLFEEGASDREISEQTGLAESGIRQKRFEMGLVRPPSPEQEAAKDKGKKSAASELAVASDLLREGYEVFRSVGEEKKRSCDLVVLRPETRRCHADHPRRVEVLEVERRADGSPRVPPSAAARAEEVYDTLALVFADGGIFYLSAAEVFMQRQPPAERPSSPAGSELP